MKTNSCSFRVRYGETDQMGIVYYGNYAQYLEIGRVEWLRALGVSYKRMEDDGIMLPVISLQIRYRKSARYDDIITVTTTLKKKPGVKIAFDYQIHNETQELLVEANTVLAFMDKHTLKPVRCPDIILDKLDFVWTRY